jgi:large subunit ribosomal protein L30
MANKIRVKLIRSGIGRPKGQRLTLRGLGLTKMNKAVILEDTAETRGMIRKVSHLVELGEVSTPARQES